ncbi:MAG TPA: gliding motility-associated C-terminal domain-containing protein, partial [Saprospiraceae bacterium]|nr:gliding motility-associated C-terminal domain-containing protein [Saprospiraceae bacterium]
GTVRWYDANPALGNPSNISTGATFTPNLNNALAGNYTFWLNQTDGNGCVSAPTSITLTINALPSAPQASDPAAICAEQAIPTLSTTAPGTVRWYDANPALGNPSNISTGATFTPNLNNALAGNYAFWLNQTDGNGCVSAPTSISMTINALPVLNISNTIDPGCNLSNGSIAVNATGDGAPFNYQLNNGPLSGTGIFSNLDAGNYTIRVQDSRGCTDAITTLLVAPNGVVAIAGENRQLTCLIPNLTLDGSASTGPNGFSYEWTRDGAVISTAPTFNVSEGGTYILTVAFEGCINRDTVLITNNIRDIVATINPSATQLTCAVNNIILDGSASTNGANTQYEWQRNNTAISGAVASRFDATLPGTYRLIVTDNSNGCTNAATFDIVENRQLPQVNAGADQLLNCNMPTANLSGTATANGPLAYAWLNSSGAILSNTNTLQANVPGAYVLRVTNMENSCVNEDQVQINSDFDYPIANAGNGGQLDCVVTELSLGGTGTSTGSNFSLSWRVLRSNAPAPQPTATPVVSNPGLYVLTVINNRNGCTTSDSALVTQVLPDNLNFQVLVTPPSCTGRNNDARIRIIPQDNTATFVYRIGRNTPFSSQNAFTEVRAGTYLLVAQDIYGCEWDTTITIEPITPVQVNLGGNRIVRLGEDVQLEAMLNLPSNMIRSVQWLNPERLSCADCLTPRIEALMEPLTPAIFVTDMNGCTAQASINIFINKERRVFVPTAFSPNGDGSNDRLVFFGGPDVRSVKSMQIFTRWGEKVFEKRDFQPNDPEYGWDGTFRGAGNRTLNPGVFVYVAEVEFIDGEVEIFKGDVTLIK